MGFQPREDPLLGAAPVVKSKELARAALGVGEDHLELIAVLVRGEQPQLERFFALLGFAGTDEDEAALLLPALISSLKKAQPMRTSSTAARRICRISLRQLRMKPRAPLLS